MKKEREKTLYSEANRANSWAEPSSGTPALTLKPRRRSIWTMRDPNCPVAPATNTVPASFRRAGPGGLLTTGIKDLTSDIFPQSNWNGLRFAISPSSPSSSPALGFPSRKDGNWPLFFAKTVKCLGVLRDDNLECGAVVRRNEFEVDAIRGWIWELRLPWEIIDSQLAAISMDDCWAESVRLWSLSWFCRFSKENAATKTLSTTTQEITTKFLTWEGTFFSFYCVNFKIFIFKNLTKLNYKLINPSHYVLYIA